MKTVNGSFATESGFYISPSLSDKNAVLEAIKIIHECTDIEARNNAIDSAVLYINDV